MSANNIELQIFGQVLRLSCPPEQQAALLASAKRLEDRVSLLKEQTQILQLDKLLAIIALNLTHDLEQEKQKNADNKNILISCIEQLDSSLGRFQASETHLLLEQENA